MRKSCQDIFADKDGKLKLKKPEKLIGFTVKERCPECESILVKNLTGNIWCSNLECSYHIHSGRRVYISNNERKILKEKSMSKSKIKNIIDNFVKNNKN